MIPNENICKNTAVGESPGFNTGFRVWCPLIILRGSSGLLKISWDGLDISEGCAVSVNGGAGSAAGAEPAVGAVSAAGAVSVGGAGSGDAIGLSVRSCGGVRGVRIVFESSEEFSKKKRIILIIFFIFSSKFLSINLFNNIINSSGLFIIIIIFFNNSLNSFRLKIISLLKIIFFLGCTSLSCGN